MRRLGLTTCLAGLTLFIVSCTASPSNPVPAPSTPLATFQGEGVSFRYPATWTAKHYLVLSSFSNSIVYLSNEPLHDPCHTSGNGQTCGAPIDRLGPGGVFVSWSEAGFPFWTFQKATGTLITVGGHRAKIQVSHPGDCRDMGGDESISVTVERPAVPNNSWGARACIRGPNVAAAEAQVRAMLSTATFPSD